MRRVLTISAILLLAAASANADLARCGPAPGGAVPAPAAVLAAVDDAVSFAAVWPASPGISTATPAGLHPLAAGWPAQAASETAEPEVIQLPPGPGGDLLCLSGLVSLGAVQVLRRARYVHLHVPEWYHADSPHQIGHSVAFDPTLGFELLAVCLFDIPPAENRPVLPQIRRELLSRRESQFFLAVEAPRGPPHLS